MGYPQPLTRVLAQRSRPPGGTFVGATLGLQGANVQSRVLRRCVYYSFFSRRSQLDRVFLAPCSRPRGSASACSTLVLAPRPLPLGGASAGSTVGLEGANVISHYVNHCMVLPKKKRFIFRRPQLERIIYLLAQGPFRALYTRDDLAPGHPWIFIDSNSELL